MTNSFLPILPLLISYAFTFSSASISPASAPHPGHEIQQTSASIDLIKSTCDLTQHKEECITVLTSEPMAHRAKPKQLAAIALRLAQQNGTETTGYVTGLLDQTEAEPNTQQCLTDCIEDYELALAELDDASAALDDNPNHGAALDDAVTWIKTAMGYVKTCQDGCKEGAEHANVMTKRNGSFNRMCSIAISIIHSLK